MSLLERTQKDMVAAMKAKDEMRLGTIRMLKAALMKYKVDNPGKELNESEEMKILNSLMKQRREAADMFRKGGREDQAVKEEAESKLLEGYMPAGASEEEIDAAVAEALAETGATSAKQMGLVVKAAQAKLTGKRVDGKALADKVKGKLS